MEPRWLKMVWWLERESERGRRGRRREGTEESALLQFVLYKAEVVFLSGRLTLFPHRLSKLP